MTESELRWGVDGGLIRSVLIKIGVYVGLIAYKYL